MIDDQTLSEWKEIAQAATPNLVWGWAPAEGSSESPAEYMAKAMKPGSTRIRAVWAGDDDPDIRVRIVAFVGDGPTSDANAEFIAIARNALPQLLQAYEELKYQCKQTEAALVSYQGAWQEVCDRIPPSATNGMGDDSDVDLLDEIAANYGIAEVQQ